MSTALVITPTTGSIELIDAVRSVKNQTHRDVHHLLVVDGKKFYDQVDTLYRDHGIGHEKLHRCDLPFNTGSGGWYGHRIMAGFSHLTADFDYVLFLDQDNWLLDNHVQSLVDVIEQNQWDWAHSLRQVYSKDGQYICDDNCESLGRQPVYWTQSLRLIDTSAYCYTNRFIRELGHHWDYGWGADRVFYQYIYKQYRHENYGTTGSHTLCYRLGGSAGSVQAWMFLEGNKPEHLRHPELVKVINETKQQQGLK